MTPGARLLMLRRYWAPATLALLGAVACAVIAGVEGDGGRRFAVAVALLVPSGCCLLMLTPSRELTSPRKWGWAVGAVAAIAGFSTGLVAMKLVGRPVAESASIERGARIALPEGTRQVRVEVEGMLADPRGVGRLVFSSGASTAELNLRARQRHLRAKGQRTLHTPVREVMEDVRLGISNDNLLVDRIEGQFDGPLRVKVFAEALSPLLVVLLSSTLLVGTTLLQRLVGLPANASVAAGAALGFGALVFVEADPDRITQQAVGAVLGGLLIGAVAGTLVRWTVIPGFRRSTRRQAARR